MEFLLFMNSNCSLNKQIDYNNLSKSKPLETLGAGFIKDSVKYEFTYKVIVY